MRIKASSGLRPRAVMLARGADLKTVLARGALFGMTCISALAHFGAAFLPDWRSSERMSKARLKTI